MDTAHTAAQAVRDDIRAAGGWVSWDHPHHPVAHFMPDAAAARLRELVAELAG